MMRPEYQAALDVARAELEEIEAKLKELFLRRSEARAIIAGVTQAMRPARRQPVSRVKEQIIEMTKLGIEPLEIAKRLGCHKNTVYARLSEIRKAQRQTNGAAIQ